MKLRLGFLVKEVSQHFGIPLKDFKNKFIICRQKVIQSKFSVYHLFTWIGKQS